MNGQLYATLHQLLEQGKDVVLVRVVRHSGSAPRGTGSGCLLTAAGKMYGSIGGGILEYRAMERAQALLTSGETALTTVELSAVEVAAEGMICGGRVDLFFEPILAADLAARDCFAAIHALIAGGGSGILRTRLADGVPAVVVERLLLSDAGEVLAGVASLGSAVGVRPATTPRLEEVDGGAPFFLEPVAPEPEIVLFGGGHVGEAVGRLAVLTGFRLQVIDDRPEFASRQRFPEAEQVVALPFAEALKVVRSGRASYVVIMTRGHLSDLEVLEMVLRSPQAPAYIGMIGSRRKRDTLFAALRRQGVTEAALAAVHCPIGLDIGAQTPAELAVSILAEIIAHRKGRGGGAEVAENPGRSGRGGR